MRQMKFGRSSKARRENCIYFRDLVNQSWSEIQDSGDGTKVLDDFTRHVMQTVAGMKLIEPAFVVLLIRVNQIVNVGLTYVPESQRTEFLTSKTTVQAILAGIEGRLHAIDEDINVAWIRMFLEEFLDQRVEISNSDFNNGNDRNLSALILALTFGYSDDDPLWQSLIAIMNDRRWRNRLKRVIRSESSVPFSI